MDVNQRLKYLDSGTINGVYVSVIIESPSRGIAWIEKYKVSSIENAEEDVCEIIFKENQESEDNEGLVFVKVLYN